jgi:hypothetical protein
VNLWCPGCWSRRVVPWLLVEARSRSCSNTRWRPLKSPSETPGRGEAPAGRLLHLVRAGSLRSRYQTLPSWSAPRPFRKARAATTICRLLREARGTSPPVHGPVWADAVCIGDPARFGSRACGGSTAKRATCRRTFARTGERHGRDPARPGRCTAEWRNSEESIGCVVQPISGRSRGGRWRSRAPAASVMMCCGVDAGVPESLSVVIALGRGHDSVTSFAREAAQQRVQANLRR